MTRRPFLFFTLAAILGVNLGLFLSAPPPEAAAQKPKQKKQIVHHPRGYVAAPPAVRARLHAEAHARHGSRVARFPRATAATFDCRTAFGCVLPVDDQGQCGDCFGVSSMDGASMVLIKAGQLPNKEGVGRLSSQYGLDYPRVFQGGCNGGDEAQVIDEIKQNGAPLTSDYGPYTASPGRPKDVSGMKMWKIKDWGYCTPSQQSGIASVQDIKDCMVRFGPISVAFDASGCDSYQWPQVMKGRGGNVDHAVLCIGWDDSKQAFLGMNQWGSWGGPGGTFWIDYGSYSWGTEAIWMTADTLPPPPPPGPGPGPGPVSGIASAVITFTDGSTQKLVPESGASPRTAVSITYSDGSVQTIPPAQKMPPAKTPEQQSYERRIVPEWAIPHLVARR